MSYTVRLTCDVLGNSNLMVVLGVEGVGVILLKLELYRILVVTLETYGGSATATVISENLSIVRNHPSVGRTGE